MFKNYLMIFSLTAFVLVFASCSSKDDQSAANQAQPQSSAQATSGDVSVTTIANLPVWKARDLQGNFRSSDEWIGKQPVVVNFWGTWCPPCRMEIPDLVKLYGEYKPKGVEIVSLAVRDTPQKVETFSGQYKMNWVMLLTNQKVQEEMQLGNSVPTTIFLDRNGKETARFVGAQSYSTFKQAFDSII